mmetsp:Transcript_73432/g.172208  ORF Transcript_73432/g.172208 Transcript_73432/m.172208 type:complete len:264 (-) Transcript_73432:274-1065(-)
MASMPEIVHPLGSLQVGFGLRHLVVVMRELEVFTSSMDIQVLPIDVCGHDRALNVPARTSRAPLALPSRLARLRSLPKGEVVGAPFLGIFGCKSAFAFFHLLGRSAQRRHELPVVVAHLLKGGDVEVDTATGAVGHAHLFQPLNELLHTAVHVLRDPCHNIRPQNAQGIHVFKILLLEASAVCVKNGMVAHRMASLFVELLHQHVPRSCQNLSALAGFQSRLDLRLELRMLAKLELMLCHRGGVLLLILGRSIRRWLYWCLLL